MMIEMEQQLGPYTLRRLIGRGGMSFVYEAADERMGRRVAIKVITVPPGLTQEAEQVFLARIRREARATARITHPNIVTVYDVGENGRDHYIVMEYLEGVSLRQWIDAHGPLLPSDAAIVLDQVAAGLDAIHAVGIVHRDLKPSNIMLTELGDGGLRARILDFGVARPADEVTVTQVGALIGTPSYLAPEIAMGARPTPSADLWSLGVLLYEMLTGHPPFEGDLLPAVVYKIVHENFEPALSLPSAVQEVLQRALAKKPGDRFPNGRALATAFRNALTAPTVSQPLATTSEAPTILPSLVLSQAHRSSERKGWAVSPGLFALLCLLLLSLAAATRVPARLRTHKRGPTPLATLIPPPVAALPASKPKPSPTPATRNARQETVVSAAPVVAKPTPHPSVRSTAFARARTNSARSAILRPSHLRVVVPGPKDTPLVGFILPPVPSSGRSPHATSTPPASVVASDPDPRPEPTELPPMASPTIAPGPSVAARPIEDNAPLSDEEVKGDLEGFLKAWIEASVNRDIDWMMEFYPTRLERYYTLLDVSNDHVRRDKERIFGPAQKVEMKVRDLVISASPDGTSAILHYRKDYKISGGPGARQGVVEEELHVRRDSPDGDWKIYYERDPRVL